MNAFWETVEEIWQNRFVRAGVYLVLAFLVGWLASAILRRLVKLLRIDERLGRWGGGEGRDTMAVKFIGKLAFLIVFLLFMPAVLTPLGLDSVSAPLGELLSDLIGYLPNIIAALILLFVGIFVGGLVSELVTALLTKTKIDSLTEKIGKRRDGADNSSRSADAPEESRPEIPKLSVIIGKILYAMIVLIAVIQALTVLGIEAISAPALSVINTLFTALPDLLLAAAVVAVGIFLSNIIYGLLYNLLRGIRIDSMVKKTLPAVKSSFSAAKLISEAVRVVILIFIFAEGIDILGLEILSSTAGIVLGYLPNIIAAILIALAAFFGAGLLKSFISKNMPRASGVSTLATVIIYVIAAFMILSQLELASSIVSFAFVIILGALAVAFAIAFGIGGRDFAKSLLGKINLEGSTQGSASSDKEQK